jgi:hypothetical protein
MARITRETGNESIQEIEIFDVDLSEADKASFRSAPERFAKDFLESEGFTVNRVVVERRLQGGDGTDTDPGFCDRPLKLVHAKVGSLASTWIWMCPHPI